MKLRTRLLLALLAASVVPVGLVTILSYRSSLAAFRETVEAEGRATAAEMARRMGAVEADLSRRVEGLGRRRVPVPSDAAAGAQNSEQLLAELERELGAATALLDRVEIVPSGGTGAEPPGDVPPPAPVVIDVGELLKNAEAFVPDMMVDGTNVTYGALERLPPETRRAIEEALRKQAEAAGRELERAARQLEDQRRAQDGAVDRVPPVPPVPPVPRAAPSAPTAPAAPAGRELTFRIKRPGGTEADLKARLSIPRLLGTVVGNMHREAGEVPFAVGADGRLYTPDPRQEPVLRALHVAERVQPGETVDVTANGETWSSSPTVTRPPACCSAWRGRSVSRCGRCRSRWSATSASGWA